MSRQISCQYTDFCPRLNENHTIAVKYTEIPILGSHNPGYKIISYECEYSEDCTYQDKFGRCTVFLSAPDEPF